VAQWARLPEANLLRHQLKLRIAESQLLAGQKLAESIDDPGEDRIGLGPANDAYLCSKMLELLDAVAVYQFNKEESPEFEFRNSVFAIDI
jgi:hypothetical protein